MAALFGGSFLIATLIEKKLVPQETIEGAGEAISRTEIEASNAVRESVLDDANTLPTLDYNGHTYVYNENIDVLLIMGIDDRDVVDYEQTGEMHNDMLADLILVAVFDKESKTYSLLQINRDSMVDVMYYDVFGTYAGMLKRQIAMSHTYRPKQEDACEDTKFAVSHLLYDVEIDNYFSLTMNSIAIINDSVGGVTVTIEDDFSRIDESLVKGETITLQGDQAEHYVRGRMKVSNDPTNINRMKRQRTYMSALLPILGQKVSRSNSFAFDLFDKLSPYMVTDCTYDQLSSYIGQFSGYTFDRIIIPDGRSVAGEEHMEFYIDEDSLKSIVIDLFYVQQD
ncbi:MAG: LCP family protein [Clostridiales bacterium]|nr:LCP family protein [Clostridiales bacterium]MBR3248023.1 LCP family protein [Clostridiales bacterium]